MPNSICHQTVEEPQQFYQSARSFGHFLKQLGDYPAEHLYETIPRFHDTVKRTQDFAEAVRKDVKNRASQCREEIDFALAREADCGVLMNQLQEGILPLRVTHNDTKLNNILFDADTDQGLCIIRTTIPLCRGWRPMILAIPFVLARLRQRRTSRISIRFILTFICMSFM